MPSHDVVIEFFVWGAAILAALVLACVCAVGLIVWYGGKPRERGR